MNKLSILLSISAGLMCSISSAMDIYIVELNTISKKKCISIESTKKVEKITINWMQEYPGSKTLMCKNENKNYSFEQIIRNSRGGCTPPSLNTIQLSKKEAGATGQMLKELLQKFPNNDHKIVIDGNGENIVFGASQKLIQEVKMLIKMYKKDFGS